MTPKIKLDTDIHATMLFHLLFGTQDDRYEPDSACYLLRGLRLLDDESAAVAVKLWAVEAERVIKEGVN